jgi:hypothetical protein
MGIIGMQMWWQLRAGKFLETRCVDGGRPAPAACGQRRSVPFSSIAACPEKGRQIAASHGAHMDMPACIAWHGCMQLCPPDPSVVCACKGVSASIAAL